ncbi:glycosyltransferase [Mameliella sp. CS4]|uniref:CgeB family protein n=1 Tax=Mameliella sp. CS4 TaxID=2862329 RepID=UPI001C5D3A20|nr:glycosyltransferase [Mameliella sp. CS4]MBW4985707.1 glycosyltransferase [Mameliella sp. CS4]
MTAPLRVLIPFHAAPDTFQDNVAHTLRQMGHEVMLAPGPFRRNRGRIGRMVSDAMVRLYPYRWEAHERFAVEAARHFRPDLVICLTQSLRSEVLAALREVGAKRLVAWWGDTPANMRGMGLLQDGWDRIFIKDALAVQKMRAVGLKAELMHEAINPDWHCPQGAARDNSVAVVGNYYGYRQFLVRRLMDAGVELALHGFAPPRWGDPRIRSMHTGRYITRRDKSAVFEGALASLNCTAMSEGDSLNCRAFEICGAGGLQLIEAKPSVAECFEPGEEVLTYASVRDILDWLDRARQDPAWADGVRAAGRRRAHAEHTYAHRLARIMEVV